MNAKKPESSGARISPEDIFFVLFRRKWLILGFLLAGIISSLGLLIITPRQYTSTATLMLRYVVESRGVQDIGQPASSPDSRGENILNSETEILISRDLAETVAIAIGAPRILGGTTNNTNIAAATAVISGGLKVAPPKRGNILSVSLTHRDPDVCQLALDALIKGYKRRHAEIHRNLGTDDFLTLQANELRRSLDATEEELRKLKAKAGILSVEGSRHTFSEEINRIRSVLLTTESDLATQVSIMIQIDPQINLTNVVGTNANLQSLTNNPAAAIVKALFEDYRDLEMRIESLRRRRAELLSRYTEENPVIKQLDGAFAQLNEQKKSLENKEPKLAAMNLLFPDRSKPASGTDADSVAGFSGAAERYKIVELMAKMKALRNQLEKLKTEAAAMEETTYSIIQLQRRRDLEETNYRHFFVNLEQARFDLAISEGKTSNINVVQSPTLALADVLPLYKKAGVVFAVPTVLGLVVAALLDLVFFLTVRQPSDVENKLSLPLWVTIPFVSLNGHSSKEKQPSIEAASDQSGDHATATDVGVDGNLHFLHSYIERLREQITVDYSPASPTAPRFIGVTSCTHQAGTTTIAMGLAKSLAEISGGKILLVDMNPVHEPSPKSSPAKPVFNLVDILETNELQIQSNQASYDLVPASTSFKDLQALSTVRFYGILQKLENTQYTHIVFDLPVLTSTSITLLVARQLHKLILVVESERTPLMVLKRAGQLLAQGKSSFGVILNKYHNYLPSWLHSDL